MIAENVAQELNSCPSEGFRYFWSRAHHLVKVKVDDSAQFCFVDPWFGGEWPHIKQTACLYFHLHEFREVFAICFKSLNCRWMSITNGKDEIKRSKLKLGRKYIFSPRKGVYFKVRQGGIRHLPWDEDFPIIKLAFHVTLEDVIEFHVWK